MYINFNRSTAHTISLIFYKTNISRRVPTTQCKLSAPEIGDGGEDILAVRLEEENTICCKIDDIIAVTCDETEGFR